MTGVQTCALPISLLDTDVIQEEAGDIVEPENEAERVKDTKKKKKKKK